MVFCSLTAPNHRRSLGLDPRVTINTTQAARGPRIKSEGTLVGVGTW